MIRGATAIPRQGSPEYSPQFVLGRCGFQLEVMALDLRRRIILGERYLSRVLTFI